MATLPRGTRLAAGWEHAAERRERQPSLSERPFRVLILSGSDRRQYNCPGVDSKSRALMVRMAERLPQEWEIDYEDLGNVFGRARIQSCNACVSTSMALVRLAVRLLRER